MNIKFCPKCGTRRLPIANNCHNCGHALEKYEPRAKKQKKADPLAHQIKKEYEAGDPAGIIAARHKISQPKVYQALIALGVERRAAGRRLGDSGGTGLTVAQIKELLRMDKEGITHSEIGKKFGICRERVRQIVQAAGYESRRSRIKKQILKKQEILSQEIAEHLAKKEAKLQELAALYKTGATANEIAQAMGMTPSCTNATIINERKKHPKLFPYRGPDHQGKVRKRGQTIKAEGLHNSAH